MGFLIVGTFAIFWYAGQPRAFAVCGPSQLQHVGVVSWVLLQALVR